MTCPEPASLLLAAEGDDDQTAAHARGCVPCAATLDELQDTLRRLRAGAPRIAIDPERLARIRRTPPLPARSPWISIFAAACSVAATAAVVILSFDSARPPGASGPAATEPAAPQERSVPELAEPFRGRSGALRHGLIEKGGGGKASPELPRPDEDVEKRIRDLIGKLGDESVEARDHAEAALARMEPATRGCLEEGRAGKDPEIAERCRRLLNAFAPTCTDDRVQMALRWLTGHQRPDGSWESQGGTALAVLAYLGSGHTTSSPEHGRALRDALRWLISRQDAEGCVGPRDEKYMYDHATATWALVEAAVLTDEHKDWGLRKAAGRAVDFLVAAQNPGRGWRYSARCGDNDTSVTFWASSALAVARRCGFPVPQSSFDGARAWVEEATLDNRVGYTHRGTGKVFTFDVNEHFNHHETMTAAALAMRLLAGESIRNPAVSDSVSICLKDPPSARPHDVDYYYWHVATLALFLQRGPDHEEWKAWNEHLLVALAATQDRDGSWRTNDRWSGEAAGARAFTTAVNALTLEVYYRYPVAGR